jgi:hypothetical protein
VSENASSERCQKNVKEFCSRYHADSDLELCLSLKASFYGTITSSLNHKEAQEESTNRHVIHLFSECIFWVNT